VLILDDGWQATEKRAGGSSRLTGFGANGKFPGGLRHTVSLAKTSFHIEHFLVWHAVHGYWGGLSAEAFPGYELHEQLRWYSPEVLAHSPTSNAESFGAYVGTPAPGALESFYDDYHRALAEEGVDGVKVDNQASVEGLCIGMGGRVAYMLAVRKALEQSVGRNFNGSLINCMSCSSEMLYACQGSVLTRTSTDFWPNLPASHGAHVYTNAVVGLWFGEFIQPDWDMFQSGHAAGAFHAAARAVSGGPFTCPTHPAATTSTYCAS
jgi:raffinose synthase